MIVPVRIVMTRIEAVAVARRIVHGNSVGQQVDQRVARQGADREGEEEVVHLAHLLPLCFIL